MFKNVVRSLEPGETPSYSASHQAPNYAQNSSKRFGAVAVRLRLFFQFTYVQFCISLNVNWLNEKMYLKVRFNRL